MAVFRSDPCGILCMIITYLCVCYADYVVVKHLVIASMSDSLWGALNAFVFNIIIFLLVVSHLRAVFSDPGLVPLPRNRLDFSDMQEERGSKEEDGWTVCMKCETYRPPRAHHCRVCRRCVKKMDHHCPWINNCVGEYNQKFFIQFLFYVGLSSLYAIALVIASFVIDSNSSSKNDESARTKLVHSIVLIIECVLFGLFVIAIGCDQFQAILSDETAVEHVKGQGRYRPKRPKISLLAEVFGRGSKWLWLCPFSFRPITVEVANYAV
ncbi:DgyrCDS10681 [Dimorphilus gyrociliatus]|uniref:Palmitoyltransferase n=1 Tax=Dimorphilus gyrociliatus TaxID=2664684 RepID=A0A7I8W110_9ANNE|nr:DgyrCDS10681 [Dimorphilus gyrociliatus]